MVASFCGREKYRFWELDFVRGLCVLLMVFDHCMYCFWDVIPSVNKMLGTNFLSELAPLASKYWVSPFRNNIRLLVITAFFIICGISCTLTRGNFRRFIPLAIVAGGITAVTTVIDQSFLPGRRCVSASFICSPRVCSCMRSWTKRQFPWENCSEREKRQTLQGRSFDFCRDLSG